MKGFLVAGASIPGTDHTMPGQPGWKNNQDAFRYYADEETLIAVVTDGCSRAPHSEVGAQLAAELMVRIIAEQIPFTVDNPVWGLREAVRHSQYALTRRLSEVLCLIGGSQAIERLVAEYCLFTIVGVVMTSVQTVVFSLGDGVWALNGKVSTIGPFPDNAPPYLGNHIRARNPLYPIADITVHACVPTAEVENVVLATDGALHLPEGELVRFGSERKFTSNPDNIRRRLAVINREHVSEGRIKYGPLFDDTTVLVIQKEGA